MIAEFMTTMSYLEVMILINDHLFKNMIPRCVVDCMQISFWRSFWKNWPESFGEARTPASAILFCNWWWMSIQSGVWRMRSQLPDIACLLHVCRRFWMTCMSICRTMGGQDRNQWPRNQTFAMDPENTRTRIETGSHQQLLPHSVQRGRFCIC